MKKLFSVLAASIVLGSFAFAQEEEKSEATVAFKNELSSDTVEFDRDEDDQKFTGMSNRTVVDLAVGKVTAGIDATMLLNVDQYGVPESLSWSKDDFDWYATFSPVPVFTLGFSANNFIEGSYFIVEDRNVENGNLGSDGFSLFFEGIENLKLGVTVPFGMEEDEQNYVNDDDENFNIGFGAEYDFGALKLGASAKDVCNSDDHNFGVFASFVGVENFIFNVGYSYNDITTVTDILEFEEEKIADDDKKLINASASYEIGSFSVAFDYLTTLNKKFYAKVDTGYGITEAFTAGVEAETNNWYDDLDQGVFSVKPKFVYTKENLGDFEIGVRFDIQDSDLKKIAIPVKWTYEF